MKNVRVWFQKDGAARYISHLDLNRCMMRALQRARLPVWYTEGFNPHPFATFALPLSLGVRGLRESMDIKLLEEVPEAELIDRMNRVMPEGIHVFAVTEPQMKPGRISYALYQIALEAEGLAPEKLCHTVGSLLAQPEILVEKRSKAGIREVDLKEHLCRYEVRQTADGAELGLTLPAGSTTNVNPSLLLAEIEKAAGVPLYADTTRCALYNEEVEPFA